MKAPEKAWLTIGELAHRWNQWGIGTSDILHYMEIEKLSANIKLTQTADLFRLYLDDSGRVTHRELWHGYGLFRILDFGSVLWKNIAFHYISNLYESRVVIAREGKAFCFAKPFCVNQDDLLIMMADIKAFEEDHETPLTPDMNMQLPTNSKGREMIPIRLIPFITNENIGPESLAYFFAKKGDMSGYKKFDNQGELIAYRMLSDGKLICMKRAEWDTPLFTIQSLSENYKKQNKHYAEWRVEALKLLPPAFVWRDEFEKVHSDSMLTGDNEKNELNWCPCIPEDIDTAFLMKIGTEITPIEPSITPVKCELASDYDESPDQDIETPEEYATRRRGEGARKEIIAYELKLNYGNKLQWHAIARLVAPDNTYTKAQEKSGNPRKLGQAWAKKGKKMKEMTSS